MPDREMLNVLCYDVGNDATRARVARTLERVAVRVQQSVFEVWLTAAQARRLRARLEALLDEGDSLRVYAIPQAGLARSAAVGGVAVSPRPGAVVI